jgi:hypothetical protein
MRANQVRCSFEAIRCIYVIIVTLSKSAHVSSHFANLAIDAPYLKPSKTASVMLNSLIDWTYEQSFADDDTAKKKTRNRVFSVGRYRI